MTKLVDPYNITNYNRSRTELEALIIFCACVAGRQAAHISKAVDKLLHMTGYDEPFKGILKHKNDILKLMKSCGIGPDRKARTLIELAESGFDLKTCSIEQLESIYGIGMKTSRFFVLHSRPNIRCAVLDTHMLKRIKSMGYRVPKSTPTGKRYYELERIVLSHIPEDQSPADFDLSNWNSYTKIK